MTTAERKELVELRCEVRMLRMERDLLSRAAAFFAQENVLPRLSSRSSRRRRPTFRSRFMCDRLGVSTSGCQRHVKLTPWRRPKIDPFWSGPPLGVMELEAWLEASQGGQEGDSCGGLGRDPAAAPRRGAGVKAIARRLGLARNTVRGALRSDAPPSYERPRKGSIVDAVEPRIRELLGEFPEMPATVIAERIGWERSIRVSRDRVAELRPLFVPPDPCQRTSYEPGELAPWDLWQPEVEIPLGFGQADKC